MVSSLQTSFNIIFHVSMGKKLVPQRPQLIPCFGVCHFHDPGLTGGTVYFWQYGNPSDREEFYLVGGFNPFRKIWKSVEVIIPNIWEIKHVPNHQPVLIRDITWDSFRECKILQPSGWWFKPNESSPATRFPKCTSYLIFATHGIFAETHTCHPWMRDWYPPCAKSFPLHHTIEQPSKYSRPGSVRRGCMLTHVTPQAKWCPILHMGVSQNLGTPDHPKKDLL